MIKVYPCVFFWGFLSLLLSGCANFQTPLPLAYETWADRQSRLGELTQWTLSARVSINSPDQVQFFTIDWHEQPHQYQIRLTGSFGQTAALIQGSSLGVEVTTAEGTWTGNDLEDFGSSNLQLAIPFSALKYWVLGLPAPGATEDLVIDSNNRLQQLSQFDWVLTYRDYDAQANLPRRLQLEHENWRLNMVIQQWELPVKISAAQ